ncbi:MAG: endopeptidase La [Clostridia bacterium]|nr:endopeptidase La [Clostridia bacterium]
MSTIKENLPVVPLRGLVVLPGEMLHFDAGRTSSVHALEEASLRDCPVFISSQLDVHKNDVTLEDMYPIGTVCRVKQVLCLPGDSMRVLVEGKTRAKITHGAMASDYWRVDVCELDDVPCEQVMAEALRRRIHKALNEFARLSAKFAREALDILTHVEAPGAYADAVANVVFTKVEQRQAVLEEADVEARMKLILTMLNEELEIRRMDMRINEQVKKQIDQNQREYYLNEQMKAIRKELGRDDDAEADEYRARLEAKDMPETVRKRIQKEIDRLDGLPSGAHEAPMARSYIECLLDLPWTEVSEDNLDVKHARKILDEDHYGLDKVKDRIVEYIAVAARTHKLNGQILCFIGPPGVGKTSISSSIARAMGRKFVRMSLGGVRDEAEIRGHRRTYIGAMPGRVIAAMRQADVINPVILFDEIDKLASDYRGDPAAAMLEVLDSAQNDTFQDHFVEIPYDLSKVMFITTANNREGIPEPLLDRMEIIDVPSYLETEKIEIAKRHLLPKQKEKHGIGKSELTIPDTLYPLIINGYTAEAGVRSLERTLGSICRKAVCELSEEKTRIRMGRQKLINYLGQPKYDTPLASREDAVGVVTGLAWTSVGGVTMDVEVQCVKGSGQILTTGQLGDVMQESARAALTYVRAQAAEWGIDPEFLKENDLHVHVPEGAVPKDGPSAGVTMMTAIVSCLTDIPVRAGVAMTGEITLRGRVLPIGGLREKLLAALRAGAHTVVVPEKNRKDMEEVPAQIVQALHIVYADDARAVLQTALVQMPHPVPMPLHVAQTERIGAMQ